jgi:Tol biopolymer transport system component
VLAQVSVSGGDTSIIPTPFSNISISDIAPDHSQLLARDLMGTNLEAPLWSLPLPAGTARRLPGIVGQSGTWSRDGRQLAFSKGSDIYVGDANGANSRKLTTVSGAVSWMNFSPDGTRLRYTRAIQGDSPSIWEINVDGGIARRVANGLNKSSSECCGSWTADGRYYLFLRNVSGSLFRNVGGQRDDVWALREFGGIFRRPPSAGFQLTTGPISLGPPLSSADSRKFFAQGLIRKGELIRYEHKWRKFAPFLNGMSGGELDYTRDGKWVAYVSYPDRTLWRSRVDGSQGQQLTYPPVAALLPRWSPDGTQIAYVDLQPGRSWRIFLISAQGGTPQDLLSGQSSVADPNWSPDGKQICFGMSPYSPVETKKIQILDLSSKKISAIPGSENLYSPRWSPDGRYLAALSADSKDLHLYDFKTQHWKQWINEPGAIGFPNWSRDSTYIYYDNTSVENSAFLRVKVGQTRPEFVIDLRDMRRYGKYGWAWSGLDPDDSPLLVRDVSTDEIYAMDLELP